MDFIEFCDSILNGLISARRSSVEVRGFGQVVSAITLEVFPDSSDALGRELRSLVGLGLTELRKLGLVSTDEHGFLWKISQEGLENASDLSGLYRSVCSQQLEPEQEQLLKLVNRLSQKPGPKYADLHWVNREEVLSNGWSEPSLLDSVARELDNLTLMARHVAMGGFLELRSTYSGLVWEYRRDLVQESTLIRDLLIEWETTSVEFKQELHLDTSSQKARFIRNVLGLVNTQASGRRWMIVGFSDKTRAYYRPPDSRVTQERIEELLSHYTVPVVEVRYSVVQSNRGQVGKLEVLRDSRKLPYSVAQSVGDPGEKRIEKGQVFVRHGSRTVQATERELSDLIEERSAHISIVLNEATS